MMMRYKNYHQNEIQGSVYLKSGVSYKVRRSLNVFFVFFEDNRCIVATKTKAVALSRTYHAFLSLVKRKVYTRIKSRIVGKVVNGWRYNIILNSQNSCYGFNCAGGTQ